jgi:hypothetical protein
VKRVTLLAVALVLCLSGAAAAQASAPGVAAQGFATGVYGSAEYLLWWTKDSPVPVPLVTDDVFGPGTRVLLGGDDVDLGHRNGARFTVGYQLDPDWAVEAVGFFLATGSDQRSVSASGLPGSQPLFVPFIDATLPGENVSNLALPGAYSGTATQTIESHLWGIELNAARAVAGQGPWRLELLGGFRYLRLGETLSFATSSPDVLGGPVKVFQTVDVFDATNDFYGLQLGLRGRYETGNFTMTGTVKVAAGVMHQGLDVSGSLRTNQFTIPTVVTYAGGYFAQGTNIGSDSRNVAAVVPEAGVQVGYRVTRWLSLVAGYTFLYASNVLRPGEQVDRTINPTQSPSFGGPVPANLVGPARPRVNLDGSDFWAHGLSFGARVQF